MIALLIVVAIVLIISNITYWIVFHNSPKRPEQNSSLPMGEQYQKHLPEIQAFMDDIKKDAFEEVTIVSYDGLKLYGRYYQFEEHAPLKIEFHGYRGTAFRDFCCANSIAKQMHHNVLLVDQRAHGKSGGTTITFGIKERYDCLSWIQYANQRFGKDTPIFLSGVSMGASTVLMASELNLPPNVVAIIADCGYSSPKEIICHVCKSMKLPAKLLYPFIALGAMLYGNFSLSSASAIYAVKKAKVPIFFAHGEADDFVPCSMSKKMYEACASPKTILTVPNAAHGMSYFEATEEYEKCVENLMRQVGIYKEIA